MAEALAIIVTEAPGPRFTAALELAATWNALNRSVALLLQADAVAALRQPAVARALDALWQEGIPVHVCQSAMHAHGLTAPDLPPGLEALGLVAFLADHPGAQVLLA